ncbi:MAG TPA: glycosyl hydrolase family 8, partial [Fibrobacteria bacterium]|nr:glycosyl hydrolase family 8 [Fibrobacteria bacterium]
MSRALFATLLVSASVWAGTPKYPFPTFANYPAGTRYSYQASSVLEADIQSSYDTLVRRYYDVCPDGQRARIKWDDPTKGETGNNTVSEGIGYGMIIFVYMDNAKNNTQGKFDKLWKYYQSFLDGGDGLMHWKINGCNGAAQEGSATDGDLDAAFALLMAYKQWGNESYLTDAKKLIASIWNKEVESGSKILKSGNRWTDQSYNPSYFATGVLRIFKQVDPSHDWLAVADANLALAKKNQNTSTGLSSDWCDGNGGPKNVNGSGTDKFGYDAVRTPWRISMDYLWFGTKAAEEFITPLNTWIKKATNKLPYGVKAEYKLDGSTTAQWTNPVYAGALIIPSMLDSLDNSWTMRGTKGWEQVAQGAPDNYFNNCWQIINSLTNSAESQAKSQWKEGLYR